jgi:hypothetical protein
MKYSIIKCINGAFSVDSQHGKLTLAKVRFHAICQTLWNAQDVVTAKVMIVDEQLNCVEDYREYIHHEQEPEPTPEPEQAAEE